MSIHTAASYLITSGFAHGGMSQTGKQWTEQHYRASQACTLGYEIHALGVTAINGISLERPASGCGVLNLDAQLGQHVYQVPDIKYIRYVLYRHLIRGKQYGTKNLQDLVLGALRTDGPLKSVTSLYKK